MVRKKKKRVLLLRYLQKNDVVLRIYTSFAFLLTLTGVLIGFIFIMLYEKNYVRSYVQLLTSQGKAISKRGIDEFKLKFGGEKITYYNILAGNTLLGKLAVTAMNGMKRLSMPAKGHGAGDTKASGGKE